MLAGVFAALSWPAAARAQTFITGAPPATEFATDAPADPEPLPPRPAMSLAVGMGSTFDSAGFQPARVVAIPAFFAVAGIGGGFAGFELGLFASTASGRSRAPDSPVDRLAVDGVLVLRPWARRLGAEDRRYGVRVLRALGAELGLGLERDARVSQVGSRFGLHTGLRAELPLSAAGQRSEVRLRLAVRRMLGLYTPQIGEDRVGNTVELYAALAVTF
jgi:hypothetical protein